MAEKAQPIILPEKYYHTYFCEVLEFVQSHSGHLLDDPDVTFLTDFNSLAEDSQCLFVRLSNRKGPYYRSDKLDYAEIKSTKAAITELVSFGFVTHEISNDPLLYKLFTKSELANFFQEHNLKQLSKDEILLTLYETDCHQQLLEAHEVIKIDRQDEVEFFKFLFFGRYKQQMTEFVIRDVGHIRLESLDKNKFTPWFDSRKEALAAYELSKLLSFSRSALRSIESISIHLAFETIPWDQYLISPKTQHIGDKLFLLIGRQLERENKEREALIYYSLAKKHPARERQIRLLDKLGEVQQAKDLADDIISDHWNASEYLFAKDFLNRPKIRINRSTTSKMMEADSIVITFDPNMNVEAQALAYFERKGYEGVHGENHIWKSLFGLIFWDELFDQSHGDYHHPLQRGASDLYTNSFFEKRADQLTRKLNTLKSSKKIKNRIRTTFTKKKGLANPMVYWYDELVEHLDQLMTHLPLEGVKTILLEMSKNLKDNATGFPDLFIWNTNNYHLYEVKSPNDHLSSQQLFWLNFMQDHDIKAEILKLKFE
jgi:hypothetical protein